MKRTIKFRAQRLDNGKWVYGDLEHNPGNKLTRIHTYDSKGDYQGQHIVIPESVCQFTGLLDRNRKEIYEGDIVKYDDTPYNAYASPYSGEVVFYCGSWRVKTKGYGVEWVYPYLFRDDFANRKTELLGNIYDNPELLK